MTNFDGILKIANLLNRVALVIPRGDLQIDLYKDIMRISGDALMLIGENEGSLSTAAVYAIGDVEDCVKHLLKEARDAARSNP